jgi:hypothetical protein
VAKVRIIGAALGSIMPIIMTHHIASSRTISTAPFGGIVMAMSPIARMSAARTKR